MTRTYIFMLRLFHCSVLRSWCITHRFCFLCKYFFKLNDKALLVICSEEEIRFYVATFIDLFEVFVRSEVARIGNLYWCDFLHRFRFYIAFSCITVFAALCFKVQRVFQGLFVTNACALKRMNGFETRKTSLTEPFSKIFLFARLSVRVRLCLE